VDLVSGCYSPGRVYVFAGDGKNGFAASITLNFKDGKPVSTGSAMHVSTVDWDRDGDVDLLIGNIKGEVHFVSNEGSTKSPTWGKPVAIQAPASAVESAASGLAEFIGGKADDKKPADAPGKPAPIRVNGDAGPMVADWDGDGTTDLVVGADDGSVRWYRNTAKQGAPVLAEAVILLGASKRREMMNGDGAAAKDEDAVGSRAKVAVFDWNGDGRVDLLVGDFASSEGPEPKLTEAQVVERDKLRKERDAVQEKMDPIWRRVSEAASKASGIEMSGETTEEQQEKWSEAHSAALKADPDFERLNKEVMDVHEKLRPLEPAHLTHGYVRVFLRK
jgi:hypothetical protein